MIQYRVEFAFLMPRKYKDILYQFEGKRMNYLTTNKKISNVLVIMSFVDIIIFLKGLLDGKGCILNTIYKCFGNVVILFSYFTSFSLKNNK